MVYTEGEYSKVNVILDRAMRRKLIFNKTFLDNYKDRIGLDSDFDLVHLSNLNEVECEEGEVKLERKYLGSLGLFYDELNELEKIGLNKYKKRYLIIYSLENKLAEIIKDVYGLSANKSDYNYRVLCGSFLKGDIGLSDLGITTISNELNNALEKGYDNMNFLAWGQKFTINQEDCELRASMLAVQLIIRRAYLLNTTANGKIFEKTKLVNDSLVVLSVGLANVVYTSDDISTIEDLEIITKTGSRIHVKPIIIDNYLGERFDTKFKEVC